MKPKYNASLYESIQHFTNTPAKVAVNCIRSSAYHWHYDYELIAVLKGEIEVLYGMYGPEAQKLFPGDLILINPKGVHSIRGISTDNICLCLQFSSELLEPVPAGMKYYFFLNSRSREYENALSFRRYVELMSRLCLAHRRGTPASGLRENAWLYMLLSDLLDGASHELRSTPKDNEKNTALVMEITAYIEKNLAQEKLPEAICREFGLSEKGIYLLLKEIVGLTLKEVIDTARIEQACRLLQDPRIPLTIISDRCGYSGEPTFYRRFKSAMGITPGQYRKGVQANSASNEIQDYLSCDQYEVDSLLRYWAGLEEQ